MRTPQIVLSPIGTNRLALSIPGVAQIRSVLIDNPSGAWLLLRPTNDYIPPYVIGWVRQFIGGVTSVDILFQAPSGQIGTQQGDPPIVVLDTEAVPDSAGSPSGGAFIEGFTPVNFNLLTAGAGIVVPTIAGGASGTWIAAVPTKRIRILTATIQYVIMSDSPCHVEVTTPVDFQNPIVMTFKLTNVVPQVSLLFQPGLDLPVGSSLDYIASSLLFDTLINGNVTYQLI